MGVKYIAPSTDRRETQMKRDKKLIFEILRYVEETSPGLLGMLNRPELPATPLSRSRITCCCVRKRGTSILLKALMP